MISADRSLVTRIAWVLVSAGVLATIAAAQPPSARAFGCPVSLYPQTRYLYYEGPLLHRRTTLNVDSNGVGRLARDYFRLTARRKLIPFQRSRRVSLHRRTMARIRARVARVAAAGGPPFLVWSPAQPYGAAVYPLTDGEPAQFTIGPVTARCNGRGVPRITEDQRRLVATVRRAIRRILRAER